MLAAVVVLLAGVCVWGVFGHMDTTLPAVTVFREGAVTAYVRLADAEKVQVGATVTVNGVQGRVVAIGTEPVMVDDTFTAYMRKLGEMQAGEWVCAVTLEAACPEGVHTAQIVIDSVSPMSFVLN